MIRLWDVERGQAFEVLQGHRSEVYRLAYLPDGKRLVSGCKDGVICLWSAAPQPRAIRGASRNTGQRGFNLDAPWHATFSADGQSLIAIVGGQVERWSPRTAERVENLTALGTNNLAVVPSPDGRSLVVGDTQGRIKVWDWARGSLVTDFAGHGREAHPLCFTADGSHLVSHCDREDIKLWQVDGWTLVRTWRDPMALSAAAVSPDGRRILVGHHRDGDLTVLDAAGGRAPERIRAHRDGIFGIAYSPDRRLLGTSSAAGETKLWHAATLTEVRPPLRHREGVAGISFSPDGRRVATGSAALEHVKLWDTATHQELMTLQASSGWFVLVRFSPDGNTLVGYSDEGALHLWHAPAWAEIDAAEKAQTSAASGDVR
jgi:WD40 repeat protein